MNKNFKNGYQQFGFKYKRLDMNTLRWRIIYALYFIYSFAAEASVSQLIKPIDKGGEQNDIFCSDGIDNDVDGLIDCEDLGCRIENDVGICKVPSGFRFSIVANVVPLQYDFQKKQVDTYFSKLQLRAFGEIPYIPNSYFLLSGHMEKESKVGFALFQIPLWKTRYLSVNSGGTTLSNALVQSSATQLLLRPATSLYEPFEGDNGVSVEIGGPITQDNKLTCRAFVSGGMSIPDYLGSNITQRSSEHYRFTVGSQLGINLIGLYSQWNSPFLYQETSEVLALLVGAKFDQRAFERFFAADWQLVFRYKRLVASFENYVKREIAYGAWQIMYHGELGYLLWPEYFLLGVDGGQFWSQQFADPNTPVDKLENFSAYNYWQARAVVHWFFWKNTGIASLAYVHESTGPLRNQDQAKIEDSIRIEAQYRF
jgi:hypothetical protein